MSIFHISIRLYLNRRIESHFADDCIRAEQNRASSSAPHDMDRQDAALMAGEQIINKVANNRVWFVSQFRYDPANQRPAASVPFEIDRAVRGFAVNFRPTVRATGALVFSGNQIESPELRIGHDLF